MKRLICIMLGMLMAFSLYPISLANDALDSRLDNAVVVVLDSPWALVNNKLVEIDKDRNVTPYVNSDDRTMVPVRFISETFNGTKVDWDEKVETVTIQNAVKNINFTVGESAVTIDGMSTKIDTASVLDGERVFVPLRAIAEALGKEVFYDRGLIILSEIKDIYDLKTDRELLDEIFIKTNAIPTVGSAENLKNILEDINRNTYRYESEDSGGGGGAGGVFRESLPLTVESSKSSDAVVSGSGMTAGSAAPAPGVVMENGTAQDMPTSAPAPMATSAPEPEVETDMSGDDYSKTNTQVSGVDEADVVKTDGINIYYLKSDGTLTITQAVPADNLKSLVNIKFTNDDFYPQEMYVDGDDLILIGNRYIYSDNFEPYSSDTATKSERNTNGGIEIMPIKPVIRSGLSVTSAYVYSVRDVIANKDKAKSRIIDVEGNYLSSRKVGSNIYLATNKYFWYNPRNFDDNIEIQPYYAETRAGGETNNAYISYEKMRYFPNTRGDMNYLIVAAFNIDKPEQKVDVSAYLGAGNNMYMSADNMFVARTVHNTDNDGRYRSDTEIFKFGLADARLSYKGKGEVPGTILNQFSMDEHKGFFRIATNEYYYDTVGMQESNNIYILDEDFKIAGKINEIAPRERIYSTRFMGDKMYMVTFKKVDPLFVIDLSNPYEPKVLGKLKIPGYSDYLHPYDENHIIGFGKDADSYGDQDWAYYQGMKMAMFDVSDVENPKELFNVSIGDRGTDSELLYNHKALLFSKEKNIIAFPATVMKKSESDKNSITAYGQFEFQGGLVYGVDMEKGFDLKGTITHLSKEDYLKSGNYWGGGEKDIKRMLYIGNAIYGISNYGISSHKFDNIEQIDMMNYNK